MENDIEVYLCRGLQVRGRIFLFSGMFLTGIIAGLASVTRVEWRFYGLYGIFSITYSWFAVKKALDVYRHQRVVLTAHEIIMQLDLMREISIPLVDVKKIRCRQIDGIPFYSVESLDCEIRLNNVANPLGLVRRLEDLTGLHVVRK